ncbi:MAG: YdcF family protein [Deltaproteobacteria bacterium]|nr:MAG: YdcF family protein [Deltaproteobacteria bacterium]
MLFDFRKIFFVVLVLAFLVVIHEKILSGIGSLLVVQDIPAKAEAAVVLNTGVDIYPRLIEAANLYKQVKAEKVVINGNRKSDILRELENSGYEPPYKWYAKEIGILTHQGVAKDHIVAISAEDAYDTISEAKIVGETLINNGMENVIITTSKFHSRRARHIWRNMYKGKLKIYVAPARNDPFNPEVWWKNGRQIRWVLSEYGAWAYYYWMKIFD